MALKHCAACDQEFLAKGNAKTCGVACSDNWKILGARKYKRKWRKEKAEYIRDYTRKYLADPIKRANLNLRHRLARERRMRENRLTAFLAFPWSELTAIGEERPTRQVLD